MEQKVRHGISLRAVCAGLLLCAVISFIVCYAELITGSIQIGFLQMPPAAIGIFFFLALLNKWLRALGRRLSFSAAEMLMIYCMMVTAAMTASRGILEKIIPLLVTSNYFANLSNNWDKMFFPYIRKWMVPFDPDGPPMQQTAVGFFEGLKNGNTIPWDRWIIPLAAWGVLVLLIVFGFLCMAALLRRQWIDNEKLSFPLVQLPVGMAQETAEKSLFANNLLWAGVAVPVIVFTINGLHTWYPAVPEIMLSIVLNPYLVNRPWNEMYYLAIWFSFAAVGFFFLLPQDLLFAIWFFTLFARLQGVIAASFGMEIFPMPMYGTPLFIAYQTIGAYVVLAAYLFYVSLPHLKKVTSAALGFEKADDTGELLPYRTAVCGLLISFLLIIVWSLLAGMSLWLAVLEFGVFMFIVALVMARSTAEAGMLMTETTFRPVDLYAMFAPLHSLGPANITVLTFFDSAFMRDQRGLLLTGFMDGLKISDGGNIRRRSLVGVFALGLFGALAVGGFLHMWIPYTKGGVTLYYYVYRDSSLRALMHYQSAMLNSEPPIWQAPVFFFAGVGVTVFLAYMRAMFFWWPFHPLGYALCVSWTTSVFWFPCLIAWILKSVILRYGGMKLYIKARPFFLGMVLGEFGMAVIWALIGAVFNVPTPVFPWP